MKKILAIVLLLALLINTMGYRFIVSLLQQQAHEDMIVRLDNKAYQEDELLELSAPLNLPYFTDWQHFERCDGRITIEGVEYNYVARRYVNNVMIYKCIPNFRQQQLKMVSRQADNAVFDNQLPASNKKQGTGTTVFQSLPEYDCLTSSGIPQPFYKLVAAIYPLYSSRLCGTEAVVPTPPPDAV